MQPSELEDALLDAARRHFQEADLDGVAVFLDPQHPQRSLAEWGRTKFAIELDVEELVGKNADEVAEVLEERVRNAYREREVTYPVESCVDRAFRTEGVSPAETAQAIAGWANTKFNVDWSPEDVLGKQAAEVRDSLIEMSRSFFDGKLQTEIDQNVVGKSRDDAVAWAKKRFGRAWNQQRFEQFNRDRSNGEQSNGEQSNGEQSNGDLSAALFEQGREMLRWELTRLEQYVLLRIYDQAWKDHLLEMDHLKTAIMQRPLGGDQTHPQSQFAIEGRDLFRGMWERIAARVTDIVFKISATPDGDGGEDRQDTRSAGRLALGHADATGAGFASADQQAAMRAQGSDGKVETIRREQPRVGRNEPCPCGSGKKYKQCHGKGKG